MTWDAYLTWKSQTLAMQTSHKEKKQKTGLWQNFNNINVVENKNYEDRNEFVVELAPGWRWVEGEEYFGWYLVLRMAHSGGLVATWGCPKYKGKPHKFSNTFAFLSLPGAKTPLTV